MLVVVASLNKLMYVK